MPKVLGQQPCAPLNDRIERRQQPGGGDLVERAPPNQPFTLHQGRFAGRPSQIQVEPRGSAGEVARILVGGQVALVATGTLRNLPG